jgi:hypothetical protein
VRVGVEGDVYAGVAQKLLDVLWMLARHEEYCSASVTQIVEPDGEQSCPHWRQLEVTTQEVRRDHGGADTLAELGSREALQLASPFGNTSAPAFLYALCEEPLGAVIHLRRVRLLFGATLHFRARDSRRQAVLA